MEITAKTTQKINPSTLHIHLKVCDQFSCRVSDENGTELKEYEGYVPSFMPGQHYGDYVILDIDLETGQIKNWKKPSEKQMVEFFEDYE